MAEAVMETRRCPVCGEPQPATYKEMRSHVASHGYLAAEMYMWRTRYRPALARALRWFIHG